MLSVIKNFFVLSHASPNSPSKTLSTKMSSLDDKLGFH